MKKNITSPGLKYKRIFVALPVMNEMEYLPELFHSLKKQQFRDFELYSCVNQPDKWWNDVERVTICNNNNKALNYLGLIQDFPVSVIDRSSKGKGWNSRDYGVGWARKTVMDAIAAEADRNDLIVSLDADTVFNPEYFLSIINSFNKYQRSVGMAVPYYHRLVDDPEANRAILRYEIYMRNYAVNLWRIKSPYSYTALGSAIVIPVWAYRDVGGLTPKKSGEDFYFLQKLRKYGELICYNPEKVYPAARFSDRVFFGTGPAMIRGREGDWESYPIYHHTLFDDIKKTYDTFPELYNCDIETPMSRFLNEQFNEQNIWWPLRKNSTTEQHFVKACHDKVDGLRILQYLKTMHKLINQSDEKNMFDFLNKYYSGEFKKPDIRPDEFLFGQSPIEELDKIRNFLVGKEEEYQKSSLLC